MRCDALWFDYGTVTCSSPSTAPFCSTGSGHGVMREGDVRSPEETGSPSACHGVSREVSHAQWSVSLWPGLGARWLGGPYSSTRGHGRPQGLTPVISSGPRSAGSDPGRQGPPRSSVGAPPPGSDFGQQVLTPGLRGPRVLRGPHMENHGKAVSQVLDAKSCKPEDVHQPRASEVRGQSGIASSQAQNRT
ncbi:unnamed protein product [Boreogadus saida]